MHLDNEQAGGAQWTPNADIVDTGSHLIVEVELPGVPLEGLIVSVNSGNITIQGNKPQQEHTGALHEPRQERRYGSFHRTMPLGLPVNTRQAAAELRHGLLRIRFPKVPNRRGEDVTIKVVTA